MLNSLFSAFLMYSRIPVPKTEWKEENRRYALGLFPLVGAVTGTILVLWRMFCSFMGTGQFLFSAFSVLIPILVTGGIHADGFCDVSDALASYAEREKRLEIMSDPHIGSFAVMKICLYFIVQTALFYEVKTVKQAVSVACGYIISRSLSGFSAVAFKSAKKTGSLQDFSRPSHKKITVLMQGIFILFSTAVACTCSPKNILCVAVSFAVLLICRNTAYKNFGGFTGDVCGWFLQWCEIVYLAVFVLANALN